MKRLLYILAIFAMASCNNEADYDAQGTFEATEIIVSAEAQGRILNFHIEEGETVKAGEVVGTIDSLQLLLSLQPYNRKLPESLISMDKRPCV